MQEKSAVFCKKEEKNEKFIEKGYIRSKVKGNYRQLRWKPA